jgi:hypothetical protein
MNGRLESLWCLAVLSIIIGIMAPVITVKGATTGTPAAVTEECLSCHGPFDKLASKTGNYVMPSGEKTTPHRYVPHDGKNIPVCTLCHKRHRVPLTSKEGVGKGNVDWCSSCHHANNFRRCNECHT